MLLGNGDGTFQPYHEADQAIELAVADLTGNGSKDIIYADQGLDRVVVDYGGGRVRPCWPINPPACSTPAPSQLADLNGDGIPDLIVANSGSNNVLIYPGPGQRPVRAGDQRRAWLLRGHQPGGDHGGQPRPAPSPDLVVADKGSNQVSILLNQSQPGSDISFEAGPRLNSGGTGPVSTVVGNFTGGAYPDILVTNSGSNNVVLLPGVGGGFFNDQNPQTFAVGNRPGPIFVGNFDGQTDLVTVNAGSNDLTLISGFDGRRSRHQHDLFGRGRTRRGLRFSSGSGFDDLVVGNAGDGVLALFEGSERRAEPDVDRDRARPAQPDRRWRSRR